MITRTLLRTALCALPLVLAAACDDDNPGSNDARPPADAGAIDAACFTDPKTYDELINACTDSVKIYKDTRPPLTNADGSLPPVP